LGLSVQDTDDGKGVKVLDVDDEGLAYKAGIKEGDVITMVDDRPVNGADDIARLIREKREQPTVKLQVNRGGKTQTFDVKMKKPKTIDL
jgi:serine protease Do